MCLKQTFLWGWAVYCLSIGKLLAPAMRHGAIHSSQGFLLLIRIIRNLDWQTGILKCAGYKFEGVLQGLPDSEEPFWCCAWWYRKMILVFFLFIFLLLWQCWIGCLIIWRFNVFGIQQKHCIQFLAFSKNTAYNFWPEVWETVFGFRL